MDIPGVSERILKTLEKSDWTLDTLADAKPEELTVIPGIGATTAWRIIVGARRLTREKRAALPVVPDPRWLTPASPEPSGPRDLNDMSVDAMESTFRQLSDEEIPPMSIRVKRVWLRNRLRELMQ